jgi:hypothetical protein
MKVFISQDIPAQGIEDIKHNAIILLVDNRWLESVTL